MNKILFSFIFSSMILHGSIGMAREIYYYNAASISSLEYDKCIEEAGGDTFALRDCDREVDNLLEEELNRTYQRLLKKLDKMANASSSNEDEYINSTKIYDFKKKLIAAQRAWIKFRELDGYCVNGLRDKGTIGILEANAWYRMQTINMIDTLKHISDDIEMDEDNKEITSYNEKEITVIMNNLLPKK